MLPTVKHGDGWDTLSGGAKEGHIHDVSKEQMKNDKPASGYLGVLFIFSDIFWGDCFLKCLTHQQ